MLFANDSKNVVKRRSCLRQARIKIETLKAPTQGLIYRLKSNEREGRSKQRKRSVISGADCRPTVAQQEQRPQL
jgi:hypothetical protein